ncbi:MAG TPA: GxxExxY protein [Candidatus Sulfotelmatobacter sp.]|nr:GxxExxY protein [Candidatus Sulfotelmatobacter sp.]
MNLLTTESQRHREIENEQDPRTAPIIGAAIEVHRQLGPGLLESAYDEVIVELKSVERILPVHEAQLLTYLRLSGKTVGLLINFNVPLLTRGIIRRVL